MYTCEVFLILKVSKGKLRQTNKKTLEFNTAYYVSLLCDLDRPDMHIVTSEVVGGAVSQGFMLPVPAWEVLFRDFDYSGEVRFLTEPQKKKIQNKLIWSRVEVH